DLFAGVPCSSYNMLYLPSAGKLFIPVHRTGYSSFEDFIKSRATSVNKAFLMSYKEIVTLI
ncbi:MAG: hypothetical protein ABSG48_10760, partial [Geobacteraceae bacterium]